MQTSSTNYRLANLADSKVTRVRKSIPTLGLAIPFQPCIQDKAFIYQQLLGTAAAVKIKMSNLYDESCISNILARLERLLRRLNYNSHSKSVALIIGPDEEKVIYLNFHVKPAILINEHVSLLQVISNQDRDPEFYMLFLKESNATLYEYYQNVLRRVYIKEQSPALNGHADPAERFRHISKTIELLNFKDEKPIFITGSPNIVEQFCNSPYYNNISFTLLYEVSPFCDEIRKSLLKEISSRWDYWQSKFILGSLKIAQKTNCFLCGAEAVLKHLKRSSDGWLLIDKNFKRQLHKSSTLNMLLNTSDSLMNEIERFLNRGNRLEITAPELLNNFGGIVLLQNEPSSFTNRKSIA